MRSFTSSELDERRPVWSALSELYLDMPLRNADLDRIAATLAKSPYSLRQLEDILYSEVYPACFRMQMRIGRDRASFDPKELEARILRGSSWTAIAWITTMGTINRLSSLVWFDLKRRIKNARAAAASDNTGPRP